MLLIAQPNFQQIGFSTQNGGTTGGKGGQIVTATSYSQLKSYAESSNTYIIMVEGTISNGSAGGAINIKSNKSIIGIGSTAFLNGIGLAMSSGDNIIVQNLKLTLVGTSNPASVNGGDCISISGTSNNIWIDHCEMYSEDPNVQTNIDKYDGLLDIKHQTGFITISWCYFHDHHKCTLVGSADDDLFANRKVTFHHNYYKKVKYRIPMYRGATGHFFNNYIVGAQDASEIRIGTCVRVEKNYYESFHYAIYTPTDAKGFTERIDNYLGNTQSRAFPANCTANIPYDYSSVLTSNTQDVKTIVSKYAGVGVVGEDCNGDLNGGAYTDRCGRCVEGNIGQSACYLDCKGVENGNAYLDECNTCVGGTSGKEACAGVMQAEDYCSLDGVFENSNAGFFGLGYVNTDNATGVSVSWVLSSTSNQNASIAFRFANGGTTNRDGEVFVNGQSNGTLSFPPTGVWATWEESNGKLNLTEGLNEIVVTATSSDGLANIDALLLPEGIGDANCSPVLNIAQISSVGLSISPNPATNVLNINQSVNWVLQNITGIVLAQGKGSIIDISSLQKGVYFIKAGNKSFKFVKQ